MRSVLLAYVSVQHLYSHVLDLLSIDASK